MGNTLKHKLTSKKKIIQSEIRANNFSTQIDHEKESLSIQVKIHQVKAR